ncbi:TonB family protein [Roseateles chitinivorans]|uniref:energy transducer TonB n=1 Tax=Roseateles chitinivorans TaxID=2917965 RepID=UPI003D67D410
MSLGLGLVAMGAQAQTAQPVAPATSAVPAAAAAVAPMSDVDRAKRDADKVFQWIKFHAEKGEKKPAHETKAEAPKPVARPVAVAAPAPAARREPDPAAERALAARTAPETAPVPVVATASPAPAAIGQSAAQTIAPPSSVPQPMSEAPPPQVMSMSAPSSAVPAGKSPEPEPEAEEPVPLKLLRKVDPEYPRALLSQQRSGSVMVQFTVRPDGSVDAAQAVRSPDRKLSVAAVTAVKQWRFGPIPAPRQVSVEIGFQAAE